MKLNNSAARSSVNEWLALMADRVRLLDSANAKNAYC